MQKIKDANTHTHLCTCCPALETVVSWGNQTHLVIERLRTHPTRCKAPHSFAHVTSFSLTVVTPLSVVFLKWTILVCVDLHTLPSSSPGCAQAFDRRALSY